MDMKWVGGKLLGLVLSVFVDVDTLQPVIEDRCDVIEVNQVFDPTWTVRRFTQVILYDYRNKFDQVSGEREWDHFIGNWRMLEMGNVRFSHVKREWILIFYDDADDVFRTVRATSYRFTKANFDCEVEARKRLPVNQRTPILSPIP